MANNKKEVIEEANYGKTILAGILIILILVGGYLVYKKIYGKETVNPTIEEVVLTDDEKAFKKEYEDLNNKDNDGEKLKSVKIIDDNNIEYVDLKQAIEVINKKEGIMYIGAPTNQKSRVAVPILLSAMESTNIDKIYYLNINKDGNDIRDTYEIVKKKAKKTKDASSEYYSLLKLMDKYLDDYVLINKNGDKVKTGEKRLNIPTVISFKEGKVTGYVYGTVKNHDIESDGTLRNLTKEEKKELSDKYIELINSYLDDDCGLEPDIDC